MSIHEDLHKVFLAGIGAIATTAEKSKELVDTLVKKGELTVDQAKILNEELKRYKTKDSSTGKSDKLIDQLNTMSKEELEELKAKLVEMETFKHEAAETEPKQ